MNLLVTQNGRELIAAALNSGNSISLSKVYLLNSVFTPSGSELPSSASIIREENFTANLSDNILTMELVINGSTIESDSTVYSLCVSGVYNNVEQNFALENKASGLFILKEGVTCIINITLAILGTDTEAISISTPILYPQATTSSQGTVLLANSTDVVNGNATRDGKPLVVSPSQVCGPYVVDYQLGYISLSQDSSDNITGYVIREMQSSTANIIMNNNDGSIDFETSKSDPTDWATIYEFTLNSFEDGVKAFTKYTEDPSMFYYECRDYGLPSSGEGSCSCFIKITEYAFPYVEP